MVVGAETDGPTLRVRFAPVRGQPAEIEDRIHLGPPGEIATMMAVGRLLRILRAGRLRLPQHPYDLATDIARAAELVQRCQGATVELEVAHRIERGLTVWTEARVERILDVLDYYEDREGLTVRRCGGQSLIRIPRRSLIRYTAFSSTTLEVLSVEVPRRFCLR